jgi:hypothetical protein
MYRLHLQVPRISQARNQREADCKKSCGFLFGLLFSPEEGDDILLRNVICFSMDYTALYPRG